MSLKKTDENGKEKAAGRFTVGLAASKIASSTAEASGSSPTASRPVATQASAGKKNPTQQEIALRAWEIWKSKGCKPGTDLENWLEAERQLRS